MLFVEIDIEGVVQEHSTGVKAGRSETEQEQSTQRTAATQPPGRHAI
jgi:hypothetical protein